MGGWAVKISSWTRRKDGARKRRGRGLIAGDERFARGEVRWRIAVNGRAKGNGVLQLRGHWQERKTEEKRLLFPRQTTRHMRVKRAIKLSLRRGGRQSCIPGNECVTMWDGEIVFLWIKV